MAVVAVGIIVLAWLMYLVWRPEPVEPPTNVNVTPPGGFPAVNEGGPAPGTNEPGIGVPVFPEASLVADGGLTASPALTSGAALDPEVTSSGTVRYYDAATCQFYEVDASGNRSRLAEATYCNVQDITWAGSKDKAVLEFPDGANIVYDFRTQKQYTLPQEMAEFSFSYDSSELAGKFLSDRTADNWIVAVNPDGSNLRGIEPMGDNADKVDVEWAPNNQVVALSRTGEAQGVFEQQVLLIGFNDENYRALNVEGRGFTPKWTPDGQRILYSAYSDQTDYKPMLYLVDGSVDRVGSNHQTLNLSTWADKCTFAGSAAYCAVPQELPAGAGFAREMAQGVPDTVWRIDYTTGSTTVVGSPVNERGEGVTTGNLTVSGDGRFLYFTDDATGILRSMQLSE